MLQLSAVRTYIREASIPLGNSLGLSKIHGFADIIAFSFFFFLATHLAFAPVLSRIFFPVSFGNAGRRAQDNWSLHVVSQVHAFIVVPLAYLCFGIPGLDQDRAFGWSNQVGFVHAIACGYFLWDCYESVVHFTDFGFLMHALSCMAIFTMSYQPFLAYYGPRFLLWELSTVFLNFHWFMDKTGQTGSTLQLVNGVFLLASFSGVRLVYGGKMSYDFFHTLYEVRDKLPMAYVVVYGVGNILLQSLNWVWFFKMIAALRKRFAPTTNGKANGKVNGKAH